MIVTTGGRGSRGASLGATTDADSASSASGSSSLAAMRGVAHFADDDDRGVLIEHLIDRHHLSELHQAS